MSEFLVEKGVPENELIVSTTNLDGIITSANEVFCEISGYEANELIGKSHSVVRHPDMPNVAFKDLWESIQSKHEWKGIIKNLRKDGGFYWVEAVISGLYENDVLVGYKSIRSPIGYAKKLEQQKAYDELRVQNGEKIRKVTYV